MQPARNGRGLDSSDELTPALHLRRSTDEETLPTLCDEADDDGDVTAVGPQLTREGVLSLMNAAEAPHEKDTVVPPPPRESEIRPIGDCLHDVYSDDDPDCEPTSLIGAAGRAPATPPPASTVAARSGPLAIDIPTPPPFPTSGRTVRIAPDVLAAVRTRSPVPPPLAPLSPAPQGFEPGALTPPRRRRARAAWILVVLAVAIVVACAVPGSPARPLVDALFAALSRLA